MIGLEVLNRFRVQSHIARGGMGDVWLAADRTGEDVVVKTVRADLVRDATVCDAFRREIDVSARLNHQHIVHHVAHGSWQDHDVLALERVEGVSLEVVARERIPLCCALCVAIDIADALAYLHTLKDESGAPLDLVHGDVSPQNILIDTAGQGILIDFGGATMRSMRKSEHLICKPGYVSPEQSRGRIVDASSDQYTLGVVLWEMLAGGELFPGGSARRDVAIPPLSLFTDVPGAVEATIVRMLAADRGSRFPSTSAAASALAALAPTRQEARRWLTASARRPPRAPAHGVVQSNAQTVSAHDPL